VSVHVLDTPKWTVEQTLLSASNVGAKTVFVVAVTDNSEWKTIIGGEPASTAQILLASEVMRRRALQNMEDW